MESYSGRRTVGSLYIRQPNGDQLHTLGQPRWHPPVREKLDPLDAATSKPGGN